jgi:hypothetical protein
LFAEPILRQDLSVYSTMRAQKPSRQAPQLLTDLFVLAAALLDL